MFSSLLTYAQTKGESLEFSIAWFRVLNNVIIHVMSPKMSRLTFVIFFILFRYIHPSI